MRTYNLFRRQNERGRPQACCGLWAWVARGAALCASERSSPSAARNTRLKPTGRWGWAWLIG